MIDFPKALGNKIPGFDIKTQGLEALMGSGGGAPGITGAGGMPGGGMTIPDFDWNQFLSSGGGGYGDLMGGGWDPGTLSGSGEMAPMEMMGLELPDYLTQAFANIGRGAGSVDMKKFFGTGVLEEAMPEEQMHAAAMQAAEEAGLAGNRWSTSLGNKIANQTARAREETMLPLLQMWMQEQARQKAAAASAASRTLSAAMQQYMLPMTVGSQLMGMGGMYGDTEMGDWQNAYNMWETTQPEWATGQYGNYIGGGLGGYPQGTPQYDEGWASQLMGLGGGLLNFGNLFGGGGGGGATPGSYDWLSQLMSLGPQNVFF